MSTPRQAIAIIPLLFLLVLAPLAASAAPEPNEAAADSSAADDNQQAINAKQQEIAQLDQKIKQLKQQKATTSQEADLIQQKIDRIQLQLQEAQLQLKQTQLSIGSVNTNINQTTKAISEIEQRARLLRNSLRQLIQELYAKERESLISVWLLSGSLGEVLAERAALKRLQNTSITLVTSLRSEVKELARQREDLEQHQQDLDLLEQLLSDQQADLRYQEDEQSDFLDAKRDEQVIHTQRIAEAETARQEIEQDIYTLEGAGVNIKLTDATSMAQYASSLTGVRPALLLGLLKVESKLGASIGTGTFPDDMHPASREPFLRLTAKLGLDPKQAPISARPRSLRGWGGAMGPAQIMPQTWEGLETRIGQLMGKIIPNPYELADAFVGTAVMLADRGAADPAREREAIGRYIAGPNWEYYGWYIDRVLAVAKEYAQ
ncbi:hypothetical protein IH781_03565 [Patescibacteria group bacterium]|nr:hypothetical protein [Patescibacteria group bacterium]